MMRRREFITLIGGATAGWPLTAPAQQSPTRPLIGLLSPLSRATAKPNVEAFRKGLRDLGHVEGRNIALELRFTEGMIERVPQLAAELIALKPDVIVVGGFVGSPGDSQRHANHSTCHDNPR
jgi:putative ABC transport system substrate-binding protein